MFTGLIEATGTVLSLTRTSGAARLLISAPALAGRWRAGDSIAVNGVCLTAIPSAEPTHFTADLAAETLARTTLASLAPDATANLELPTPAGSPLGGHVVQGHVDGTGTLVSLLPLHPADLEATDWRLTLSLSDDLAAHVVQQGSITVDGISLTVAKFSGTTVEIAVIPHTYKSTNLHTLAAGSPVNVETDVLAKYARKKVVAEGWLTAGYLMGNGY